MQRILAVSPALLVLLEIEDRWEAQTWQKLRLRYLACKIEARSLRWSCTPLTMPGVVVSAWGRSLDLEEAGVLLGFTLSELEC
jgi:hypothetical protein